jgi:3-hydroxyisobutyrate dehydrogenase
MTTVAFFGLGHMGGPMAANLVKAGHTVLGYDPDAANAAAAAQTGVTLGATPEALAAQADVVVTMLPAGRFVLDVYAQLLPHARPGTLFVDSSTISVDDARQAHALASAAGHRALDAPVSGGVGGAAAGTLTFMVGGDAADLDAARGVLDAMAGRVVHCGGAGLGQAAKVCNNMILAVSMIAVSEAFVLGEALGLEREALFEVASTSSGQCWALTTNCPVPGPVPASPANRDYAPGFAGALMAKDLGLAAHAIQSSGVAAELGSAAEAIYRRFADGAGAGKDFSAIIGDIRAKSGMVA